MKFTALLVLLGLLKTLSSSPVCRKECNLTRQNCHQDFTHVSNLAESSVAPWNLSTESVENREPQHIDYAVCTRCKVENMIAKPIYLKISVYERIRHDNSTHWCKCPYELAVGCTCVSGPTSHSS